MTIKITTMKKFFSLLLAFLGISSASFALSNSTVLLQHQGNVIVYELDSLNAALRDAVDGDTLFLSKGTYPGFTVDKKITVRGAGQETIVQYVDVDIPDSVTLASTLLEGLNISASTGNRTITIRQSVNGLKIKQCYFDDIKFYGKLYDVFIDRCFCNGTFEFPNGTTNAVKSMIVKNSKINVLYPTDVTTTQISFVNCNVRSFYYFWHSYAADFRGSFINSILSGGSSQNTLTSMTLINTLINQYGISNTSYLENYYKEDNDVINQNQNLECIYTTDELLEKGYIGNDGTVIGCYGGATPYTLTLAVPTVKSSDVKLDAENRVLNVNLKLSEK